MHEQKFGDDFKVGDRYHTQGLTVTETHVVGWAGLTGDFYPLHMDREHAARSQFGERLAHGPMIFALAVGLVAQAGFAGQAAIAWLGVDGMRMLAPVKIGDTAIARVTATAVDKDKGRCTFATVVHVGSTLVIEGEAQILVPKRPA